MSTKTRITISLSDSIKDWFVNEAENMGVSVSSCMVMVLANYKEQKEATRTMREFNQLLNTAHEFQSENAMSSEEIKELIGSVSELKNL